MKKIILTFLMFIPMFIFSQGENDNWYFGGYAAVNFPAAGNPIALVDNQLSSPVTASVSDSNGNLLFYTNGETIMTREHNTMQNGNMNYYIAQSSITIVQNPGNANQYYIFVTKTIGSTSTADPEILMYSIVDMSQGSLGTNGFPLGAVLSNFKEIPIHSNYQSTNLSATFSIIKHHNGNSFWVVTHDANQIYSYLVDANGVSSNPVQSYLNINIPSNTVGYGTTMRSSPPLNFSNFSNYLLVNMNNGNNVSKVLSFNNTTGTLTNDYELEISSVFPTVGEFNKDSSVLYLGRNNDSQIYAVDMLNSVTSPIYQQIYNNSNPYFECGDIKRNALNDIYMSFSTNYGYLSKIMNPNSYNSSYVDLDNIYLSGKVTYSLLPNFVYTFAGNQCVNSYVLSNPETNVNHTYQASDYIETNGAYEVSVANKNISMKAGKSVFLNTGTFITTGSNYSYLAKIENCSSTKTLSDEKDKVKIENFRKNIHLKISLDKETVNSSDLRIYPNPTTDFLTIVTTAEISNISVSDLVGRKFNATFTLDKKVDVRSLPSGVYIINIKTSKGNSTQKFIKK
ncbi:T9SS type A sorting domain-containing protein [Chryseobacterium chendengshani]|uniref:T9SS type A sorting domain-containing protein n=1 Tax=Chryseobacterium sp. LJ668 TaxID=2864040 RepID=UPI001C68FBDC|nr:T9SS type A sorting domain-containing protein [Chryseobacterium sp. LJ668]MBW8524024.1 T9SS type A sorting domain-containing protein [Chryseobacterium sp. LJ668]QYK16961.1 T9SS type A sorting domain-containing protein [Chryseobacterium sp. LJ668]